ncbi:DUF6088 family protein [Agathobacter ruminis]|uniref:Abortive phage infection protein n=1 Tax=Agathobacter ruminis TaxID=1712665 RepID=A0A2G3E6X0_9FIRM|nr:DUF6088 family protein [Agathobacter ruminis]MDC7300934.1 DUF6088 family protein [Agathobacter ruminis]PHU38885.1 hypothetical protein CSX02_00075 [Agathobacter ruminis]
MREKYQIEIENRIKNFEGGYAFSAVDFADIADTDPTNKSLSRLNESGTIRRIIQGVYDKPVYSELLNEYSSPKVEKVVEALARKFNWTVAPAGETALNYLHMSTQVSNSWSYISDGPYRKYEIGSYTIEFKHCANKEISGKSFLTVSVIQALKFIGKANIQKEDIERLSFSIPSGQKQKVLEESKTTTSWIYKAIKEACK